MPFLAPALPFVAPAIGIASLFGKKGGGGIRGTPATPSRQETTTTTTPTLFGPGQLRTPTRTRALERVTPSLVERGLGGVDPRERGRLRTRAFEDIDVSTQALLKNLREIFGRTGVRGGVQGADISDILEASIGAKGAASTSIEDILKGGEQQKLQNLLQLLGQPEPFAVAPTTVSRGTTTGGVTAQPGFAAGGGVGFASDIAKALSEILRK